MNKILENIDKIEQNYENTLTKFFWFVNHLLADGSANAENG